MGEPERAKAPGGERGAQRQEDSASLFDLRAVVERIEGRPVCGMRIERTGQTSVARADVT